jgi:hypothetical protein
MFFVNIDAIDFTRLSSNTSFRIRRHMHPPLYRTCLWITFSLLSAAVFLVSPANGRISKNFREPLVIYNNWAAYDELSDAKQLTEELAMRQLDELLRLRAQGVRFDAYVMDAYWFAPDGGYREWRKPNWPDGPDRWLAACRAHNLLPGLWFSTNFLSNLQPFPAWENSMTADRKSMCLFAGDYLPHLMETLQMWYDRGVRIYKFDFARFDAVTPEFADLPREEIIRRNETAWREALAKFRARNPEAIFQAYNGYGGTRNTWSSHRQVVDLSWLEVFDSLYSGDPRPADVPTMNFMRSVDIFVDHTVRDYAENGVPLERIDSCAPMMGNAGTIYYRGKGGWKGMMLLNLAHGSWMNLLYGDLTLLNDDDGRWLAKAQQLFLPLQAQGRFYFIGGVPGASEPYGFTAVGETGSLYTVVNPSQTIAKMQLPVVARSQPPLAGGKVLFHDAGFAPLLTHDSITLGPEQMAVIGFGRYASADFDLGQQADILISSDIERVELTDLKEEQNATTATIEAPKKGGLRIVMRQLSSKGTPVRTKGGPREIRKSMEELFHMEARSGERVLPMEVQWNRKIWSGLSWAVAEIPASELKNGETVTVHCTSAEPLPVRLKLEAYNVQNPVTTIRQEANR